MSRYKQFKRECADEVVDQTADRCLGEATRNWFKRANSHKYSYHFEWLSRPIIQYPQDIVVMQELIWKVNPDLIIETGIAHGGSLIFSASMLALLDLCEQSHATLLPNPKKPRRVVAVDIDIRAHNRKALEEHPLFPRITMIQGSSIEQSIINQVKKEAEQHENIIVCLDSNHSHDHVLAELNAYAPLVSRGSYCVVFDTIIADMPEDVFPGRPWGRGDNPKTAVYEYLNKHPEFENDKNIENKILITVAPGGYLRRIG